LLFLAARPGGAFLPDHPGAESVEERLPDEDATVSPSVAAAVASLATLLSAGVVGVPALVRQAGRSSRRAASTARRSQKLEEFLRDAEPGSFEDMFEKPPPPPPPPPFELKNQTGVTAPLGLWDPLGLCNPYDEKTFRTLRAAEMKHCRIAMLATVGACWQHFPEIRLPGLRDVPSGLGAMVTPPGSFAFIIAMMLAGAGEFVFKQDPDKEVGDFGDPLEFAEFVPTDDLDPDVDRNMRNAELNNGRFAMFAAVGIIIAELSTGKDAMLQLFPGGIELFNPFEYFKEIALKNPRLSPGEFEGGFVSPARIR